MKSTPRLRLEPRPSRIGVAATVAGAAAVLVLVAVLPLDPWLTAAAVLAALVATVRGVRTCAGSGVPALLHVGLDRRLSVTARDGRSRDGKILDASYVGARVTTIVWRADATPWYLPARAILILPDSLPSDDFRRLRVVLRYGRPAIDKVASGVDADRPASHARPSTRAPLSAFGCAPSRYK